VDIKQPLWAEKTRLDDALARLGTRPLKLIADAVVPEYGESPWGGGAWAFKNLLASATDSFQFSIAGPESKQDYHRHEHVFEIYASEHAIELFYRDAEGASHTAAVVSGIMMVPPGVPHKVTLAGLTFVFQAALEGRVSEDRRPG
jgi:hypothetical protein